MILFRQRLDGRHTFICLNFVKDSKIVREIEKSSTDATNYFSSVVGSFVFLIGRSYFRSSATYSARNLEREAAHVGAKQLRDSKWMEEGKERFVL